MEEGFIEKYHIRDLTPVEYLEREGVYLKRDDLYMPFEDVPLSGGKVRQGLYLLASNADYIREECDNKVYTATSIHSPQGVIISRVAKELGMESHLFIGTESLPSIRSNTLLMRALSYGAKLHPYKGCSYESMLISKIEKLMNDGERGFLVKFGINLSQYPDAILDSIGYQVQNLPEDLDYLIIPCGSAITMSGISRGLLTYNVKPKHVVGVQISGYDRTGQLQEVLGDDVSKLPWEFYISHDFPYSQHVDMYVGDGVHLDPVYEGKAWHYMRKYMADELRGKKVCFWDIGDSSMVRNQKVLFGGRRGKCNHTT